MKLLRSPLAIIATGIATIIAFAMVSDAQVISQQNATLQQSATANGNGLNISTGGYSAVTLTVNCNMCSGGTQVNFQATQDGVNWVPILAQNNTGIAQTFNSAQGISVWSMGLTGHIAVRAPISAYSAGTVTVTATAIPGAGISVTNISPTGRTRVQPDGSQIFYDAWDTGTVDTVFNWTAATTSLGATSTPSAGQEVLATGVTASSFVFLKSKTTFQPVSPGFIEVNHQVKTTYPIPAHTYAFWGVGTPAGSPTAAAYAVDAIGFEVGTTGKMAAVTWASGGRTLIQDLSSAGSNVQPVDGNVHRYQIFVRGDTVFWVIDNITVAAIYTGAQGPDTNLLPVMLQAGNDATGGTSLSVTSAAIYVGDTTKGGSFIRDAVHPQYSATVKPGSTFVTGADASLVVQLSPNASALVNGNAADGAAVFGSPVTVGGTDGVNARFFRTTSLTNSPTAVTTTARNEIGAIFAEKGSRWGIVSNPAAGSQATASIAAEAAVRHVADCVSFSASSSAAVAATDLTVNLRDGATGAGTIIWTQAIGIPTIAGIGSQAVVPFSFCGLNLAGTTNTAMTLEFSAGLAGSIQAVSISGFNVN